VTAVASEQVAALAAQLVGVCAGAVDVDEVAAVLEARGINDRVAEGDYGVPSVFALAAAVVAHSSTFPAPEPTVNTPTARVGAMIVGTLTRSALYLTPTVVALGSAAEVRALPAVATTGTLAFGWGISQALAYLGYRALGDRGRAAAARTLGLGFVFVCVFWTGVLLVTRAPWPRGYLVSGVQLALFAATAAALVTGAERRVLGYALPSWAAAGAMAIGVGPVAALVLTGTVAVTLFVAYWPALARSPGWWRPKASDGVRAICYGVVGTGQALLFLLVVLTGQRVTRLPLEALPLLVGVPLTELTLLWHQRRVADGREELDDRTAYRRHLRSVSRGTLAALAVPVVAGAVLVAVDAGRLAAAVELTAVYALCLLLVAHRRLGTAVILLWWPAVLIAMASQLLDRLTHVTHEFLGQVAAGTLLAMCLPALAVAAAVMRDPWSYR
jgi:hypothetical protein